MVHNIICINLSIHRYFVHQTLCSLKQTTNEIELNKENNKIYFLHFMVVTWSRYGSISCHAWKRYGSFRPLCIWFICRTKRNHVTVNDTKWEHMDIICDFRHLSAIESTKVQSTEGKYYRINKPVAMLVHYHNVRYGSRVSSVNSND